MGLKRPTFLYLISKDVILKGACASVASPLGNRNDRFWDRRVCELNLIKLFIKDPLLESYPEIPNDTGKLVGLLQVYVCRCDRKVHLCGSRSCDRSQD